MTFQVTPSGSEAGIPRKGKRSALFQDRSPGDLPDLSVHHLLPKLGGLGQVKSLRVHPGSTKSGQSGNFSGKQSTRVKQRTPEPSPTDHPVPPETLTSSPPGRFMDDRSRTESSLELVSTFHLFCWTYRQRNPEPGHIPGGQSAHCKQLITLNVTNQPFTPKHSTCLGQVTASRTKIPFTRSPACFYFGKTNLADLTYLRDSPHYNVPHFTIISER